MYAEKPVIASDCLPIKGLWKIPGAGVIYPADNIDYLGNLLNQLGTLNYSAKWLTRVKMR